MSKKHILLTNFKFNIFIYIFFILFLSGIVLWRFLNLRKYTLPIDFICKNNFNSKEKFGNQIMMRIISKL